MRKLDIAFILCNDAHGPCRYAGWIGTVAARHHDQGQLGPYPSLSESRTRLAAVAGTSTCHLIQSPAGHFVPGIWGPYKVSVDPQTSIVLIYQ
jgi:ribulose kinase